jgi:hypothetical protein
MPELVDVTPGTHRLSRDEFDNQIYAVYLAQERDAGRTADRFYLQTAHVNAAIRRVEARNA